MYLCLRGKRYKGEQPLKEQNKVRFFACVTLRHPIQLRNSLIFHTHYIMAQKSDEVRGRLVSRGIFQQPRPAGIKAKVHRQACN